MIYALSAVASRPGAASEKPENKLTGPTDLARAREIRTVFHLQPADSVSGVVDRVLPPTTMILSQAEQPKPNVAGLGESLYTTHLVTVGLAGILLFVALIGAVAITDPKRPGPPAEA